MYIAYRDIILFNRRNYDMINQDEIDRAMTDLADENHVEPVVPRVADDDLDEEFRILALPEVDPNLYILSMGEGNSGGNDVVEDREHNCIRLPPVISEESPLVLTRSLNEKQQ